MSPNISAENALQAISAPLAGLFLTLTLCVAGLSAAPSQGVWMELLQEPETTECGDGRPVVLHAESGIWKLNEDEIRMAQVPATVADIMASRAERGVFFIPPRDSTVQEVLSLAANMEAQTENLHIGLVTHRQIQSMTREEYGFRYVPVACMRWPRCPIFFEDTIPILRGCK
jgi:hypothetical protein